MKKSLIIATLFLFAKPILTSAQPLPEPSNDTCNANNYAKFIGQSREWIDSKQGFYFQDPYNIIKHGEFIDEELADDAKSRNDIIYVMLDENGKIMSLTCTPPIKQ